METDKLPPPCGGEQRQRASDASSEAKMRRVGGGPPPEISSLRSEILTSPQGGGDTIVSLARTWIGTPYVHQASLKGAGCDCLGLLRGVWRELYGEEPECAPSYTPDWAEARGAETLRDGLARHFAPVAPADVAPGDVALFRMAGRGPAKHCAIVGEKGGALTLIHARQNKRVSEEPFTLFWRRRLACVFRI
jgi:NlpC/P60 family putative phage cell wall peptidase